MTTTSHAITAERFASGMTFAEYLRHIASPANLARENKAQAWSEGLAR